jgi:hypothetical protein
MAQVFSGALEGVIARVLTTPGICWHLACRLALGASGEEALFTAAPSWRCSGRCITVMIAGCVCVCVCVLLPSSNSTHRDVAPSSWLAGWLSGWLADCLTRLLVMD